jgi:hypothetical protein
VQTRGRRQQERRRVTHDVTRGHELRRRGRRVAARQVHERAADDRRGVSSRSRQERERRDEVGRRRIRLPERGACGAEVAGVEREPSRELAIIAEARRGHGRLRARNVAGSHVAPRDITREPRAGRVIRELGVGAQGEIGIARPAQG